MEDGKVGVGVLFSLLFVALKLCNVITWSWWWVFAPVWIPVAIIILVVILVCSFGNDKNKEN